MTASGPLEKVVQHHCRRAATTAGVDVCNLSQVRRSMVTVGIGDLVLLHPRFGVAFFETKRQGGIQRRDQELFQARCVLAGVPYIVGGLYEMLQFLEQVGLWRLPEGVSFERYATPTIVQKQSEIDARPYARRAARHGAGRAPATSGAANG